MNKPEMTNRMRQIIDHWEKHFPDQTEELKAMGTLEKEAHLAEERTISVLAAAAKSGMSQMGAMELAAEEWGAPPNL